MKLLINGEWVNSSNDSELEKYNPSTGGLFGKFPAATKEDVKAAIDAADESFEMWYSKGSVERSKVIYKTKELIEKSRSELERLLQEENGKTTIEARQETDGVLDQLQYYAEFARKITGDLVEGDSPSRKIFQHKIPYGVVVALTPWNFPAAMVARKLAPALMAGNSVVLKPSSDTPFTAEWIVKKFAEAGVPKGVLNFVTGKGSEIGDFIVEHKKVGLVTMTGSTSTGQRIMSHSSSNMAKLILELGGKAPFMVWKDADLKNALSAFIWAKLWNAGQSCIAAERLYIHSEIYDKFIGMITRSFSKIMVGDPRTSDMGPLINKGALETTEKFVEDAKENGYKLLTGGERPTLSGEFGNGYFYMPTLFAGADQKSEIFQEEVFGPVIGAMPIDDEDEMFRYANDSKYGLASYLFTKDPNLIFKSLEGIRFGEVYVNMPGPESSQGYHTGFRLTGQAGEGSRYGIEEYLKLKNVYVDYSGKDLKIETVREELLE